MKYLKFYVLVALVAVGFDVLASLVSRQFQILYTYFGIGSFIIYFAAGFLGCRRLGFIGGAAAGLVAGLSDATLGWLFSFFIRPYCPDCYPQLNAVIVAFTIAMVSTVGTLCGLLGVGVATLTGRSDAAS